MADYQHRISETIKRERQLRGEQPIDVAYKIGVSLRTYERWEAGNVEPRLSNLKALAEEWGVEISDLRPDLEAEARQLDRIEAKLDDLLGRLETPISQSARPLKAAAEAAKRAERRETKRSPEGQSQSQPQTRKRRAAG